MKQSATTTIITRADLQKTFKSCRSVETEIMAQLKKCKLTDTSPAAAVLPALERLARPHWIDQEAWETMIGSVAGWASAHGSLEVWAAAGTMKGLALQRWLGGQRKAAERREEAKFLFADIEAELIGDEEDL